MKKIYTKVVLTFLVSIAVIKVADAQVDFKVPAYQKFVLKNGLTVYLMEQHEVPTISISALLPAGAVNDEAKNGLATLTAKSLMFGTKSFTKTELEQQLDFLGASFNVYATKESANVSAKFAGKDQDQVLNILKEVLVYPTFSMQELEKEKTRYLQELTRATESPREVIQNFWDRFIFADHPYANPTSGKISTVSNIKRDDVDSFYRKNYSPNGSAIAVVGDFNSKIMKAKITKIFSDWKRGERKINILPIVQPIPNKARVLLVNKEDARETTMLIGGKGVEKSNPDQVAIKVINTVLGGRFTSWLNDELRVNSGLTYGARSAFEPFKNAGTFSVSTFTATETTQPTIDKAIAVLQKLKSQGIDEETLTSAKNYVKGQFPPNYETSDQLASMLVEMFFYGFDESYVNNFQANVNGLTVSKAKEIVAKYFPDDQLQFLFVGKSSEIKDLVSKYGELSEKLITDEGF